MSNYQSWSLPCGHDDGIAIDMATGAESCPVCGCMVPDGYVPENAPRAPLSIVAWGVGFWAAVGVAVHMAGRLF